MSVPACFISADSSFFLGFLQVKPYAVNQCKGREDHRPHIQRKVIHRDIDALDIFRDGGHGNCCVDNSHREFQDNYDDQRPPVIRFIIISFVLILFFLYEVS